MRRIVSGTGRLECRCQVNARSSRPHRDAGKLVTWTASTLHRTLQIVKRPGNLHTFQVLPRRWVVERTFGWIMKHRRCVRDYERLPGHRETYLYWR